MDIIEDILEKENRACLRFFLVYFNEIIPDALKADKKARREAIRRYLKEIEIKKQNFINEVERKILYGDPPREGTPPPTGFMKYFEKEN